MSHTKIELVPLSLTPAATQPEDPPPAAAAAAVPDATIAQRLYPAGPVPTRPYRPRNLVAKFAQRRLASGRH